MQYRPSIRAIRSSPAMLAYPLDGSRCACHAYQNVANTMLAYSLDGSRCACHAYQNVANTMLAYSLDGSRCACHAYQNVANTMLAYPLDGSRCACHAYQNVSNTNQFDQSRKGIELTFIHEIIMIIQFDQKVKYSFMQHTCRCYAIF